MEDPNGGGGGGGNVINTPTSDCQTAGGPWAQQKCCQQKVDNDEYDAFCSFEFPAVSDGLLLFGAVQ